MRLLLLASVVCVVVVNGWTDAPNAITSAVCTGALPYRRAAWLAALCNGAGALAAGTLFPAVAAAMTRLTNFGSLTGEAVTASLCWVMAVVALWGTAAWRWGIPTSESHALLAALAGGSLAGGGRLTLWAWYPVLAGLVLSVGLGWLAGWLLQRKLGGWLGRRPSALLKNLQIVSAMGMAVAHGAQDGQKFAALLLGAGAGMLGGNSLWAVGLCAAAMALGTSIGGERIVRRVGREMVFLDGPSGVCSDFGAALPLLGCTLLGWPVSTSHVKVCAVAGAGAARGRGGLSLKPLLEMAAAWLLTFPACFLLAWAGVKFIASR